MATWLPSSPTRLFSNIMAYTQADLPVDVVGRLFEPDKYGFALPHGSTLTHPLTIEVLGALDTGEVEKLRTRYFGAAE